ncbi:DUF1007 family protein [Terrihabitans rhizophilus]|uniref:DUF1007 family protein n=1 Tax=Terrihabitans rhizophilus TaxID=3092662 RepID=A0ABU4RU75_9HYPH|nr:DUF1007 family protein [Terrihabitans sp. PJ23]MDX6807180.1 DUF1007 family protein [Terrihabitans sp. PJ23]
MSRPKIIAKPVQSTAMPFLRILAFLLLALGAGPALAHPHVFVTVVTTVEYADGLPTGVRHDWRFDDVFSSYAVQGLDTDGDGKLSREELADLADVNVQSLKEFDYFTFARVGGKDVPLEPPAPGYWLDHDGTALTLHFVLPMPNVPPEARNGLRIEVFDPTYFVAFDFAEKDPVHLAGAPGGCTVTAEAPKEEAATDASGQLTEDFFTNLNSGSGFGARFANLVLVRCGTGPEADAAVAAPPAETGGGVGEVVAESPAQTSSDAPTDVAARVGQAQSIASTAQGANDPAAAAPANGALGAFGVVRPDGASNVATTGLFGWIARQQSAFYQMMSGALSESKQDGSALFLLAGLAFAYGVFHAAGPGHGKAVISSYLVATGETLRRGLMISFASAFAQALTAILVVGVLAGVLGVTSREMGVAAWWLELGSYVLIAAVGLNLVARRGRALLASLRGETPAHGAGCDDGCGHQHAPGPETLSGPFDWRRATTAVVAIGLRPCTGALLILVFAMAQGMVWAGIAATFAMAVGTALTVSAIAIFSVSAKGLALRLAAGTSGEGSVLAARGIEALAGLAVLAFGLLLMMGLLSSGSPLG